MNCRIQKSLRELTPYSRNVLLKSLVDANQKVMIEKFEEMKVILTNNLFKIFVVACNEELSIGKNRMLKILENVSEKVFNMHDDNDDFFIMIEKRCKQILGEEIYKQFFSDIPFQALPKNYDFIQNALEK